MCPLSARAGIIRFCTGSKAASKFTWMALFACGVVGANGELDEIRIRITGCSIAGNAFEAFAHSSIKSCD